MRAKLLLLVMVLLTGCSSYQKKWDCGICRGIGCSSLEAAENVAQDQILLNTDQMPAKEIIIKEHYDGFKKTKERVVKVGQ